MTLPVIAEGPFNTALLERMVACHPRLRGQEVRVIDEDGHYGVRSRARAIMTRRGLPVAVVLNSGSDPETPYMQRWMLERGLGESAPSCEWRIVLFEPYGEALLLRHPTLLRELVPREPTPEQLQRTRTHPRQVLAELLTQAGAPDAPQALLRRLGQMDLSSLWATRELRPLEAFLLEKLEPQPRDELQLPTP